MGVQLFILSAHVEYTAVYRMGVGGIGTREETRGEAVIHKTTQTHPLRLGAVKIPSPGSASQKFHEGSCGPRRRFVSNGCRNPPPPPRWWRAGSKSSSNKINGSVTAHMRGRSVVGMLRVRGGRNQTLLKRFLHFGKQAVTQKCRGKADKICCHQLLPSRSAHPHSFAESRNAGRPHVFVWAVVTTVHSFGDQFSKQSQCFG